ncbi:MAG TPA: hypothetical protein DEH25_02000 [Chloroflexi bacterium]|nr:hypothetical protein [Chloroflexota bacterium]HBY08191.1 hypothetical protein [Chloroflexota bacterium]
MFQKFNPFSGEEKSFSWWWLGVKLGVIAALIIWWLLEQQNKKQAPPVSVEIPLEDDKVTPSPVEAPQASPKLPEAPPQPDDLRKIEGIGPKIQETLRAAGIQTYAQLAASNPAELKQILVEAGIRLGDPSTWPEQAALSAAENWEALREFQSSLKGGRRVA